MKTTPELLVTPAKAEQISSLIKAGATAFLIGEQKFGLRLAGEFPKEEITKAVQLAHQGGAKIFAAMNAIFHNDMVPELGSYLSFLKEAGVDAVVFGDPAVLMEARESAPDMPLHWSTETTGTNHFSCNYWGKKGAKRAVLAKELSLDSVLEIKEKAEVEIEIQVHGMTCMFQSKRSLIGNYFEYQGKTMNIEGDKKESGMFLHDKERNYKYPIFEDVNGTHIMSPNDVCMIDELGDFIDAGIDSFKIDGILKSHDYLLEVTRMYREAIDLYMADPDEYENRKDAWVEKIESIQPVNRNIDTGFFFKETVY
ncbi:peptidase U32 family protein [Bacillus capparidis]|uniref:Protease n=1 Tax=Bacillus capparidis TaxID=1840411 RepID=A0ABS4CUY3_9BACI|nr:peptidase U32 family protein [Bacillus capparidis]MBP1080894.1 putative protease [Bacillus capparidis]MED1097533.1 U32 family peptidase [Bacillus capparidis]